MSTAGPGKKASNLKADAKAYEEELKKKIAIAEKDAAIGPAHSETAALLSRLGSLYVSMSKWKEAQTHLERALEIQQKQLKADHPQLPLTIGLLAEVYMKLDRPSEIELKFLQYDRKAESDVGQEHPLVGEIKYNLGAFYRIRSRFPESRESFEKSLDIWHKKLRPDHPRLLSAYSELSSVCRMLGLNEQAESLLRRTIKVRTKVLGEDHFKVGECWKEIGIFYKHIGKLKESLQALQKSLDIMSKGVGKQSPILAYLRKSLADVQTEMDKQAASAAAAAAVTAAEKAKAAATAANAKSAPPAST